MIRKNHLKMLPAALLAIGFAAGAHAQQPSTAAQDPAAAPNATMQGANEPYAAGRSAQGARSSLSHSDREFIENAAKGGMAEVELAKIAQQRASSPEVKQFARTMERDHGQANEKLRQIAQAKGVTMPAGPTWGENHEASRLQKLSGEKFDRAYMDHMVKEHRKDVKDFRKQAQKAKDPEVRSFARETAPKLEQHLQMAQNTDATVGGKQAKKANRQARNDAASRRGTETSMR